jgi:hypothetical protein
VSERRGEVSERRGEERRGEERVITEVYYLVTGTRATACCVRCVNTQCEQQQRIHHYQVPQYIFSYFFALLLPFNPPKKHNFI